MITEAEVEFIRQLISQHPSANRRQLSLRLCEAWGWRQANGALRDMVCRGLLLELARAGHLELPSATHVHRNPSARRATSGPAVAPLLLDTTPLEVSLRVLRPLEFQPVRRTPQEPLFNYLVGQYHPLGHIRPVGEHLKYIVYAAGRPIACLAWSSAPRHLGARDRFIGWSAEARRRNIRYIAYNPRYLILPWVRVPHLASPKTIVFGHRGATLENGRKTRLFKAEIAKGFWLPLSQGPNTVSSGPLHPGLYSGPADHPLADSRLAGIRHPSGLEDRLPGQRNRHH